MVAVVDTQSALDLQQFTHQINHDIVEEDNHDLLVRVVISVIGGVEDSP